MVSLYWYTVMHGQQNINIHIFLIKALVVSEGKTFLRFYIFLVIVYYIYYLTQFVFRQLSILRM
jgi:hypothetical protein